MRTLYVGLSGDDVRAWEYFLLGINPSSAIVVDGVFDQATADETRRFQTSVGFSGKDVDGVAGPGTLGKAMQLGFNPLQDDRLTEDGPNWPLAPAHGPMPAAERLQTFGTFSFRPAGTAANPEAIVMTDDWAKNNIVTADVPQLRKLRGVSGKVQVHGLLEKQLVSLFDAWEEAGLGDRLLTWGGSWVPRYVRGSRTQLSNHSWGTAFDINVQWNMLGTQPALKGQKGSVRELVKVAYEHGWYWGGWFKGRPDGMHFEAFKVVT